MALIKTRPVVRVLLGRELVAGEVEKVTLELSCRRAVVIDHVGLRLFGEVSWTYSGHYRGHRQNARFLAAGQVLVEGPREFPAGQHRLVAAFELPADAPGSWEGTCLSVEYRILVDVSLPWWFDVHREYAVPVFARGEARALGDRARVWASHAAGPSGSQPYLEVALASTALRVQGELRGSAALGNVALHRYRRLQILLVARETLPRQVLQLPQVEERPVCRWNLALDSIDELAPLPFALRLPERLVPGFDVYECRLDWLLVVVADAARGSGAEVRLPVTIGAASSSSSAAPQAAPLAVGSERMRLIWSSVAQRTDLEFGEGRIFGAIGEGPSAVGLEVRRGLDPRGGPRLIGELRMASLAIGLARRPERRGPPLRAREPAIEDVLTRELGELVREWVPSDADDRRLVFERDDSGLRLDQLEPFVVGLRSIAELLARLPSLLPAPRAMQAHLATWEAAAASMSARLRRADMRIEIVRELLRVTLGCRFDDEDGELRDTLLELDPGMAIPTRLQVNWNGHGSAPEHAWPLAELIRAPSWAKRGVTLSIGERTVQVILPAPLPDPRLERDRIELLFELGRALHGEIGPYR
ncbi:hypothetical protein ACNOYE_39475 [Nannocystaceae bacterium ST9]